MALKLLKTFPGYNKKKASQWMQDFIRKFFEILSNKQVSKACICYMNSLES